MAIAKDEIVHLSQTYSLQGLKSRLELVKHEMAMQYASYTQTTFEPLVKNYAKLFAHHFMVGCAKVDKPWASIGDRDTFSNKINSYQLFFFYL